MAPNITHAGGIITVDAYTSGTPCTFEDVYNADVAGGWGVVGKLGTKMYAFAERLVIGNGTNDCYFTDTNCVVQFIAGSITATAQRCFDVANHGYATLGSCADVANHETDDGCHLTTADLATLVYYLTFSRRWEATSYLHLYSCTFGKTADVTQVIAHRMYNCWSRVYGPAVNDVYGLYAIGDAVGLQISPWAESYSNITAINVDYAVRAYQNYGATISNVYARRVTGVASIEQVTATNTINLDDVDSDNWTFRWINSAGAIVPRRYSINIHVSDEDENDIADGTVVYCYNGAGTELFSESTTDGAIGQQIEIHKTYIHGGGGQGDTNTTDSGPHVIEIHPHGYESYRWKGDLDETIDWRISLKKKPCNSMHSTVNLMRSVA